MVLLISRSKLVPDFALTTHFLHLCVVTFVTGSVPRNALWWMTMAVSATLSVILGIYGCRRRELEPISFGGGGGSGSGSTSGGGGSANGNGATAPSSATEPSDGLLRPADGDEEQGYSRGRGRGRGRDGAGEYEMVGLKPKVDGNRRTD